jgi:MFS family permease
MKDEEVMATPTSSSIPDARAHLTGYMSGLPLALLMLSLCFGTFLVSLDRTIITVVSSSNIQASFCGEMLIYSAGQPIPKITAEFHSTADIRWYGAAYSLTSCGCIPLYGRAYQSFNVKWTFLISMAFFALGSLICAATPTSTGLIIGRAIAGLGNAGATTGGMVILTHAVALEKRAMYNSIILMMCVSGPTQDEDSSSD